MRFPMRSDAMLGVAVVLFSFAGCAPSIDVNAPAGKDGGLTDIDGSAAGGETPGWGEPCKSSKDCADFQLVCEAAAGICVDCLEDVDCDEGMRCIGNGCVTPHDCVSDKECAEFAQVCASDIGLCADCNKDNDCTGDAGHCRQHQCRSIAGDDDDNDDTSDDDDNDDVTPQDDDATDDDDTAPDCPAAANCANRECGPDPVCATDCGACDEGLHCNTALGKCQSECTAAACAQLNVECGPADDGCGGNLDCGACDAPDTCGGGGNQGHCGCTAACADRECGPDPVCGKSCGSCPTGKVCTGGKCGDAPDECPDAADCRGLACGPDPVCATSCGDCAGDQDCKDGVCVPKPIPCGDFSVCPEGGAPGSHWGCRGGVCALCLTDADCAGAGKSLHCAAGDCVECASDADCASGKKCDDVTKTCRTPVCPAEADCSTRECGPDPFCASNCGDCTAPPDGLCSDATTLVAWEPQGVCAQNTCQYTQKEETCTWGCDAGACQACVDDGTACAGRQCGSATNNCGDIVTCPGSCNGGEVCTDEGACCKPDNCFDLGLDCGLVDDGCGGTLSCGSCAQPKTCAGDGTPNVCGCPGGNCCALNAFIVLDKSGSMADSNKWNNAKGAVNNVLGQRHLIDWGLVSFSDAATLHVSIPTANDESAIQTALNGLSPAGGTNLGDAVQKAADSLVATTFPNASVGSHTSIIVLITDGVPTAGSCTTQDCLSTKVSSFRNLSGHDVRTHVIGFGSGVDANILNAMAQAGGTNYYTATTTQADLENTLTAIATVYGCN